MVAGAEVITVVHDDREQNGDRFTLTGCRRTLAERSYTVAEVNALRDATRDLSL